MLLGEEAIAARAASSWRDHGVRFVVTDLLDTDARGQGKIVGPQRLANCHVKLASAYRVFFPWV